MIDMASISAAVTSLKTATDIAKGLMEIKTATEIQSKVIELQSVILAAQSSALAAQSEQFSLLEKIRQFEAKMAEIEAWKNEADRYQLTDYGGGTFAYSLKPGMERGEPSHRICAACYQKGHKSILQNSGTYSGREKVHCPRCEQSFFLGHYQPSSTSTRIRGPWGA